MSSRFVHAHGKEGRLTRLVNRGFDRVRGRYARLLDGALQMRWAIVAAVAADHGRGLAALHCSPKELAPVEDQSHISLFLDAPPGRVAGGGQPGVAGGGEGDHAPSPRPSSCGR